MKYQYSIGLDIAKKKLDVFVKKGNNKVAYTIISNDKKGFKVLEKVLKKAQVPLSEALFCAEHTGCYTHPLLAWIAENKLDLWLESALAIKKSSGMRRGKSDKADAESIASYAYKNQDSCNLWLVPRDAVCELKKLSWAREKLLSSISQYEKSIKERKEISKDNVASLFKKTLIGFKQDLKALEKKISICVKKDDNMSRLFGILTSVTGIGPVTATAFITETNEFTKIKEPKKMACFAGIAPFEHTSGSSVRGKSRVSPFASKKLKKLLHMAAVSVIRLPGELANFYKKLVAKGKAKMVAINALRRKLIDRIYACVRSNRKYEKNYTKSLTTS